uniref:Uncharacterized protein n=1 Tax=Rhizophora mucronata TaxID=61149 RepID=A0A2P2N2I1_RHIMU
MLPVQTATNPSFPKTMVEKISTLIQTKHRVKFKSISSAMLQMLMTSPKGQQV